jgi:ribonuclease E
MCQGTGIVRSVESVALDILRCIEDRLITDGVVPLMATTAVDVALYILNQKRAHLKDIEARYQIPITVAADKDMHISQFVIERAAEGTMVNGEAAVVHMDWAHYREEAPVPDSVAETEPSERRSRRRRRKRRPETGAGAKPPIAARATADVEDEEAAPESAEQETAEAGEPQVRKSSRRRGRRGGRRGRSDQLPQREQDATTSPQAEAAAGPFANKPPRQAPTAEDEAASREDRPNGKGRERKPQSDEDFAGEAAERARRETEPAFSAASVREEPAPAPAARGESKAEPESAPRRRGWWSRG